MKYAEIPLFGKHAKGRKMLVDIDDVPIIAKYRWHVSDNGYAVNRSRHTTIRAHRIIMNTPKGMDTDHINRNKLDNRKDNLRICTRSQNLHNKDSTGTWLDKRRGTWQVELWNNGEREYLGAYESRDEAIEVYKKRKDEILNETK